MTSSAVPIVDISSRVEAAVAAAQDRKAVDLRVLSLEPLSTFAEYFLICSGTNDRQSRAIADGIERRLRDDRVRPLHVEGMRGGEWILLDYGDFVVHVMSEESRTYYGLERLWADAPDVTGKFVSSDESSQAIPVSG